jgi:tetratricopeptide (TPR) repeat protein
MHRPNPYLVVLLLLTAPVLSGCGKVQARAELKKGNTFYQQESYAKALPLFQKGLELDPGATFAWRSVGLTALALYRPGEDNQKNKEYEQVAIEAFENYLEDYPEDAKVREYLLTMYVNAKQYDKALGYLDQQIQADPVKKAEYEGMKMNILTQAGRLDQAAQLAQRAPRDQQPQLLYSVGVTAWDKLFRDPTLVDPAARNQLADLGLTSIKQALEIKPDYFEAMVYYNLLLRQKANLTTDAVERDRLITEATEWQKKASELRKKQQTEQAAQAPKQAA